MLERSVIGKENLRQAKRTVLFNRMQQRADAGRAHMTCEQDEGFSVFFDELESLGYKTHEETRVNGSHYWVIRWG